MFPDTQNNHPSKPGTALRKRRAVFSNAIRLCRPLAHHDLRTSWINAVLFLSQMCDSVVGELSRLAKTASHSNSPRQCSRRRELIIAGRNILLLCYLNHHTKQRKTSMADLTPIGLSADLASPRARVLYAGSLAFR